MHYYDIDGQLARKRQVMEKIAEYTLEYFDTGGVWVGKDKTPLLRERLWYALCFLEFGGEEAVSKACGIIESTAYTHCHFAPMAALQLMVKYAERLRDSSVRILDDYLRGVLDGIRGHELDFCGANDNFPTMSTYCMLVGGELYDRDDYREVGAERMRQLEAMLTRRGFTSEYNSPTYTPIQAYCMAEIAETIQDPAIRQSALACEERLWIDLLCHYHPNLHQSAGPYSRAYAVDSVGHTHQSRFVLYALIGERMRVNPMNTLFVSPDGQEGQVIHNNAPFLQVSNGWMVHTIFHCPVRLVEHAFGRSYPYRIAGTAEFSSSTDGLRAGEPHGSNDLYEYAAGYTYVTTYMAEDYALGVTTRDFRTGGQMEGFHLLYRKQEAVDDQAHIGTVYAKYVANGKKPGGINDYPALKRFDWVDSILDEGRKLGFQHDRTAMLLYKPKVYAGKQADSLKLTLYFPAQYRFVEEVWLGDRRLDTLEGESVEPCPVYVKDGPVYMAFFPLLFTDHGRRAAVKAERVNGYLTVSFYNYEGPPRDFASWELLLTGNGLVAEVRSEKEAGSFEQFRRSMKEAVITDGWVHEDKQTYMRRTVYRREGLVMDCVQNPVSEGIKYYTVNGKIPPEPALDITGWPSDYAVPYLT